MVAFWKDVAIKVGYKTVVWIFEKSLMLLL